jgi:hypothetical protein
MKRLMVFLVLLLFPLTAIAGEKVSGTAFYVVDQQSWETGDGSGYWMWHAKGVSQPLEGPFETDAVECHGAGFWDKDGSWGEGICVHTGGDATRTAYWKEDKGQEVGQWKFLSGTGKHAGITGEGTYKGQSLPGGRHVTEWEGEVTLAE